MSTTADLSPASRPLPPSSLPPSTLRIALATAAAVVACNLVGAAGAFFTSTDTAWYLGLAKPSFQPSGWLFGPVWTLLYSLMGVALVRVAVRRDRPGARQAIGLFAAQMVLNAIWSPIFFGAEAIALALGVILLLVVMVGLTMRRFFAVDRLAGWLLVPYLAWLAFATVLNGAIVVLNG